ncbi:MAG: response regulator [Candidatus Aminicenantes bacterium]|jgi:DNA-binding response OmpR family regulator
MSRKTIVLADNSYTIRRIVELSFSDETDIELVTFENGLNLKEKLVELRPQIVLVDIKLPEFDGYEVCKFVQGSEVLTETKVFLLKGGFEPIDENLLQDLKYENIITKPFDSNALVSNIKKLLEKMPEQTPAEAAIDVPSSLPEDEELPEIASIPETPKDINFSDVKQEIDSEQILADEEEIVHTPAAFPDDEVLPSEEITRAQPDKDTISPTPEEEDNPFEDEAPAQTPSPTGGGETGLTDEELNIKRNIEMQEKELEIDSLTLEELNIKKDIERQEKERGVPEQGPESDVVISDEAEGLEADTSDMFPDESKLEPSEPQEGFFPADEKKAEPSKPEPTTLEADEKDFFPKETEKEPEEIPDIKYETDIGRKSILEFEPPPVEEKPIPKEEPQPPEILSTEEMEMPEPEPESLPQVEEVPEPESIQFDRDQDVKEQGVEFATDVTTSPPGVREYEIPDLEIPSTPPAPEPEIKIEEEKVPEPEMEVPIPPKAPETPPQPTQVTEEEITPQDLDFMEPPQAPPQPKQVTEEKIAHEIRETMETPEVPKAREAAPTPEPTPDMKQIPHIQQEEILNKIEHKLTRAIKEMLWEIVPPLAEKIIKQEIETLTSETEKSLK